MFKSILLHIVFVILCAKPILLQAQLHNLRLADYKHWQVSSTLVLYEPLRLTHEGRALLHSLPSLSGEFVGSRFFSWEKNWGISVGLGFGITTYNTHFSFLPSQETVFLQPSGKPYQIKYYHTDYDGLYFCLPLDVSRTIQTSHGRIILLSAGIKMNVQNIHPEGRPYTWEVGLIHEVDRQNYQVFQSRYSTTGPFVVPSIHLKSGIQKPFKNLNSLNYYIILQWSPFVVREGTYSFENLTYTSKGTLSQSINFFGLEACYRMKPR